MSIRGHLPSASLKERLARESGRLDTDIRLDTHARLCIEPPAFAPIPHLVLQTGGSTWPLDVGGVQLDVVRPYIEVADVETIDVEDHTLAVVVDHCVFVLIPLVELFERPEAYVSSGDPEETVVELFEAVVPPGLDLAVEYIEQYDYAYERTSYTEQCPEHVEIHDAEQTIHGPADLRRSIEETSERLKRLLQRFHHGREPLEVGEERLKQVSPGFDALLERIPEPFSHLHVEGPRLYMYTTHVSIECGDEVYPMGRFRVEVDLRTMTVDVDSHVDNQMVDGHLHPHLEADGTPCWHAFAPRLATHLGEHRVAEALDVVWDFLRTYVPKAAHLELERFEPR